MSDIDRELLELAAKAARLSLDSDDSGRPVIVEWREDRLPVNIPWNPLTDDGDALRLATELNLVLTPEDEECCAEFCNMSNGEYCINRFEVKVQPGRGVNKQSAMRRAIVHAAAEIGRAK